jgi:RNA polymerase sigma factor (sigma-70 family)
MAIPFDELYEKYNKRILNIAKTCSMTLAYEKCETPEDITQNFWVRLYQLDNNFLNEAHFMTYARTAIRNYCISLARKHEFRVRRTQKYLLDNDTTYNIHPDQSTIIDRIIEYLEDDEEKNCLFDYLHGESITHIAREYKINRRRVCKVIDNAQKRYKEKKILRERFLSICEHC